MLRRTTGAVILDTQRQYFRLQHGTKPHRSPGPLTGVVEQVTEQFQQVVTIPGKHAARRQMGLDMQRALPVNTLQGSDQISDFRRQQHPQARRTATGDACPFQLALGEGAHLP